MLICIPFVFDFEFLDNFHGDRLFENDNVHLCLQCNVLWCVIDVWIFSLAWFYLFFILYLKMKKKLLVKILFWNTKHIFIFLVSITFVVENARMSNQGLNSAFNILGHITRHPFPNKIFPKILQFTIFYCNKHKCV